MATTRKTISIHAKDQTGKRFDLVLLTSGKVR